MELIAAFPQYQFAPGDEFLFDAADEVIYYNPSELNEHQGKIALLHEIAHAQLNHFDYSTDLELVVMESRAWQATRRLALRHAVRLDERYITNCLASYTEWLEKRANCPVCSNFSLQVSATSYRCFRCQSQWRVSLDARELIN